VPEDTLSDDVRVTRNKHCNIIVPMANILTPFASENRTSCDIPYRVLTFERPKSSQIVYICTWSLLRAVKMRPYG